MDIKYILFRGSEINLSQRKISYTCTMYTLFVVKQ